MFQHSSFPRSNGMKRQRGFSLIELMVSMAILVVTVGVVVGALLQAQRATQGVAYEANTQENLRAGMHFIVQDLAQAGEGIPQGGITIPYSAAGVSALNRPGAFAPNPPTFPNPAPPNGFIALPAIAPGWTVRSEEHTSELQSRENLVCRLLLEKKKKM